ncbi:ABC transporter permease [Microlunatus soli]|uniref:ABC-2 type transport system permease protein n=1 Tax=Microlunatus soli TaxID=630515 RepID=A0A1H1PVL4_9ACTN|nr:ABC-2 family transporter protein [Microlunatus soli]SDS15258.1 ABC-2 type transport system permease protein [Microlunatus soli]
MRDPGRGIGYRVRIARAIAGQALERDMQFRAQAWTTLAVGLLEVGVAIIPALLIFNTTTEVRGWRIGEVLMVTGFAQLLNAFLAAVIAPNQTKMSDYIREGDLDLILIRPAPAQWLAAFRWFEPAELLAAISGAAVLVVGAVRAGLTPDPWQIGLAVVWFVVGCVAISLVWMNLGYLAFWLTSSDQVRAFLDTVLTAGRYPLAFYPTAVRVVLLSIVPIGLATTVPAQALRGVTDLSGLGIAVLIIVALLIITRLHWSAGLRSYGSASS